MARRRQRSTYTRIPIIPGFLWLNISAGGISFSIGRSGARMTAGNRGVRVNTTIPGTGVRVSKNFGKSLFGGGRKKR